MFNFLKKRQFDPALYWGNIPEEFKKKIEFIRAVSARVEDTEYGIFERGIKNHELIDIYKERTLPCLETEILRKLKKSEGDLIILQEPVFQIKDFSTLSEEKYKRSIKLRYNYSANGALYRIKIDKTL